MVPLKGFFKQSSIGGYSSGFKVFGLMGLGQGSFSFHMLQSPRLLRSLCRS